MAPIPPPSKAVKNLACVDCQRRKKKCDKKSPCSNCIKNNVKCVPSSPAPPRKRRQPIKEVLQRLAACEARLDRCRCHVQGMHLLLPPLQQPKQQQQQQQQRQDYQCLRQGDYRRSSSSCSDDMQSPELPLSPPGSAASRDPAIVNVLDHRDAQSISRDVLEQTCQERCV